MKFSVVLIGSFALETSDFVWNCGRSTFTVHQHHQDRHEFPWICLICGANSAGQVWEYHNQDLAYCDVNANGRAHFTLVTRVCRFLVLAVVKQVVEARERKTRLPPFWLPFAAWRRTTPRAPRSTHHAPSQSHMDILRPSAHMVS